MGERASETASHASVEDSLRPPPRVDLSRIKLGPGALPAQEFDPLKRDERYDAFWAHIESHFEPINQDHVKSLRGIRVNMYGGKVDHDLRLEKITTTDNAVMNSFPYTQRLVAAMLDVGGGEQTNTAVKTSKEGTFWGGEDKKVSGMIEGRVKRELEEWGLIEKEAEADGKVREVQWKLREVKTVNRMRKVALYTKVIGEELRSQAIRREIKKWEDGVEICYIEKMIRDMKKNKKSRSKFQKMYQRMFGHYKEKERSEERGGKVGESNGRSVGGKGSSSKKKKKKVGKSDKMPHGNSSKSSKTHAQR